MLRLCPKHGAQTAPFCQWCREMAPVIPLRRIITGAAAASRHASGWNDERVALLKRLWAEGLSGLQIAGRLGGVSRNAVIGKVHRLGLADRASSQFKRPGHGQQRTRKPRNPLERSLPSRWPKAPVAPYVIEPDPIVPFEDQRGVLGLGDKQCKWPIGDPQQPDFHFCNGQRALSTVGGCAPYCELHMRRAYQPPEPRQRPKIAVIARSGRTGLPLHMLESIAVKEDA